jgi:hypothetical protein
VGVLLYLALAHPIALFFVLALLLVLTVWLLPKLWRFVRSIVPRVLRWFGYAETAPTASSRPERPGNV